MPHIWRRPIAEDYIERMKYLSEFPVDSWKININTDCRSSWIYVWETKMEKGICLTLTCCYISIRDSLEKQRPFNMLSFYSSVLHTFPIEYEVVQELAEDKKVIDKCLWKFRPLIRGEFGDILGRNEEEEKSGYCRYPDKARIKCAKLLCKYYRIPIPKNIDLNGYKKWIKK